MASFNFDVNDYIRTHRMQKSRYDRGFFTRHIVCADGYVLSVQASAHHGCTPKLNATESYSTVEVGVIEGEPDELLEPEEGSDKWVFPYVPVEIVAAIVWKHGGIKEETGDGVSSPSVL